LLIRLQENTKYVEDPLLDFLKTSSTNTFKISKTSSKWAFDCYVLISNKNGTFQGVGGDKAFVGFAMKYFF
jgi:hypothetical protein